jgi:hypothetical protein
MMKRKLNSEEKETFHAEELLEIHISEIEVLIISVRK